MTDAPDSLVQIAHWIERLQAGDPAARDALLAVATRRLRQLAQRMLHTYPRVQRWEQTDDVLQNAMLRLYRTLHDVSPPSTADFLRLAALNIRRELLDLAKHYHGPQGMGAHHASIPPDAEKPDGGAVDGVAAASLEPSRVAAWSEFHEQVQRLPDDEREVFDLLWYQGLTQVEAGQLLHVSPRTIKRRWQSARLMLYEAMQGELPA